MVWSGVIPIVSWDFKSCSPARVILGYLTACDHLPNLLTIGSTQNPRQIDKYHRNVTKWRWPAQPGILMPNLWNQKNTLPYQKLKITRIYFFHSTVSLNQGTNSSFSAEPVTLSQIKTDLILWEKHCDCK